MILLSIDPSSTRTGWAVFEDGELLCWGCIRLAARKKTEDKTEWFWDNMAVLREGLRNLLHEYSPDGVVIEDSSGHVGKRHGGGGAGLTTYGKAIGYAVATLSLESARPVYYPVPENTWTRGKEKVKRQAKIALLYPEYDPQKDKGGDVADAIGLGLWWLQEQKVRDAQ